MQITEAQVRAIVEEVLREISASRGPSPAVPTGIGRDGVFDTVDEAVDAAEEAQRRLVELTLEKRREIIEALRKVGVEYAEDFSQRTWEETGMGKVRDKITKHLLAARLTPGIEDLGTQAWSGDHGLTTVEMAPYGVIAAVLPSTHPVPTMLNNAISIIAAGNSVVFAPHPGAKNISLYALQKFHEAIVSAGGPPGLVTTVAEPSIESAQKLFSHPKVALLLVTGGPGVVRAAMNSGKKVIAAGPGNPPVVVDETADIPKAAKDIVDGATFDNNILCIAEKEVFVVEKVADRLKEEMIKNGSYEITKEQADALAEVAFEKGPDGHLRVNRKLVGRDAPVLAQAIGLSVDPGVRLLIAETPFEHPFVQEEQMMPFLPIVRTHDVDEAIDLAIKAEHGYYHTAIMHSRNIANLSKMAKLVNTVIFVKNGPSYAGLGVGGEGYISFSIAGPTGEGVTSAHTFTRQRRCVLVDYFRIV